MPSLNTLTDADWFWRKVDRTGDCWTWKGALDPHGYGRVILGQEPFRAHTIAWFLVMGQWPTENLYRTCAPRKQRSQARWDGGQFVYEVAGTPAEVMLARRCVRPHHMREGAAGSSRMRWAKDAQTGWPPEFRPVAPDLISTEQAQTDMMPLVLYPGAMTVGRAQALFNFTMAAQASEAARLGDVAKLSQRWPDMAHAVGLHKPITAERTVGQFWGRVLDNPEVLRTRPGMRDYIRAVLADSGYQPSVPRRIDRYSPWSTRDWRRRGAPRTPAEPLPQVWPFVPESTGNIEHDLVAAVDAAVSKTIPEIIRQDVCQDLILAVLEGEVAMEALAGSSERYVKAVFRRYPTKYGPLSLDAPLPWSDGGRSLHDTLANSPLILGSDVMSLADLRDKLAQDEATR